ncbi:DUF1080 domain-containing protein [bacterium]|nr:DUF1080 domain-containing protein [bacterium]
MIRVFVASICFWASASLVLAEAPLNQLTPEEVAEGWILLFDGETKFGWKAEFPTFEKSWIVENGILTCKTDAAFNHLRTNAVFSDFILKLDFRVNAKGNSGIFFRGGSKGVSFVGIKGITGYEAQVDDNDPRGLLYQTGGLYDVAPATKLIKGEDQWRSYEIIADGNHIVTKINGEVVCDTQQTKFHCGHIGLQQHNPGSKIEFKNIKLKPLGLKSIFNGKDLTGWKVVSRDPSAEKLQAAWVVKDGQIHVDVPAKEGVKSGGQGQLETEASYKDFIMQSDIRVNGKHFNSGIFFRSLPNTTWVGYESQIRNQWMEQRDRPIDYGTGGVYNLKPARKVTTDDNVYFKKTLLVAGNYIGVWLNGYQVTDYKDKRKPNPNPREGFYDGPGKIALQSHDPTTNLDFKNIQIVEFPADCN